MGFWIYMMAMDILIPLTMIGFGRSFSKGGPREINSTFGYRTTMSMKNKDTWEFAHQYSGKLWLRMGWVLLIVSVTAMLFTMGKSKDVTGAFGSAVCGVQLLFMIGAIFPTEAALKKNFDENGIRRK